MGEAASSRADYTASEDDNVLVLGVSRDVNAMGYFGYAYYQENQDKLKGVERVGGGVKAPSPPSEAAVEDGTYNPLSRPIFIYVNKKSMKKPEVKAFVASISPAGSHAGQRSEYVPLPDSAYKIGLARVKDGKTGTAFGGHSEVGVKIDESLARPLL